MSQTISSCCSTIFLACLMVVRFRSAQAVIDERLEDFERHLLRQTALVQFEFGGDDGERTSGVVHALAEQLMAEASLFPLSMSESDFSGRLFAPRSARPRRPLEQYIDGFLQHALLVAHDDFGSHAGPSASSTGCRGGGAAIKMVEVGRGEASAIEWNQRAQLGWNHRQPVQYRPLRFIAALAESLDNFQALAYFRRFCSEVSVFIRSRSSVKDAVYLNALEKFLDSSAPIMALKPVRRNCWSSSRNFRLVLDDFAVLGGRKVAGIDDDVGFEVENTLRDRAGKYPANLR